ncbi:Sugar transporter [Mycena sanguinolenta]|uniref:Sugar transporter n=1 Tax=Mycena sanguinolenta TaxID=230812 RepID=A0A8H7D9F5_9AGAR|nr:Sugar transporter [Mycena sanguinolenta]
MRTTSLFALLNAGAAIAAPLVHKRQATTTSVALPPGESLTTIDPVGEAQAQQRDNTATRAFSAAAIKTSDGQCLEVIPGTGDSRNNLVPVNILPCDGSPEQQWDVITAGVHNNAPGTALFVSSLIQGCLNFDPRRAAGNQVILFSCGGRADGSGGSTNSQQFTFDGTSATIPLAPTNQAGTCLFNNNGKLDQQSCTVSSPSAGQLFTIDGGASSASPPASTAATTTDAATTTEAATTTAANTAVASPATTASVALPPGESLTTIDPVGEAQAQQRDNTATRAFSAAALKTSDGQCLEVIPGTGDSRNNLVPVNIAPCDGSAEQQWDVITAGVHNDTPGTALFVSSLIQGCLNFDPRRAAGNQVILFSCGGRADGSGGSTNSQQFTFDGTSTTIPLAPTNQASTCLFNNNGKLDQQTCTVSSPSAGQLFTISP